MGFSITAQPVLGIYRGHGADGTIEPLPSVDRLMSALLCAAGFGPRAVERAGELQPSDVDQVALRWLEQNPPQLIHVPPLSVCTATAIAYRDDGTLGKGKVVNKIGKQDAAVAVAGPFVWTWTADAPEQVMEALGELCGDVPSIGTSESPMIVRLSEPADYSNHERAPDDSAFDPTPGLDVTVPVTGRFDELTGAFRVDRKPGRRDAGVSSSERSVRPVPARSATTQVRYRERLSAVAEVPWPDVYLVPLDRRPALSERVRWSEAAHKALIRILGAESPPALTGAVAPGTRRQANNIALHFVDETMPIVLPADCVSALAVMLPRNLPGADHAAVLRALGNLDVIFPSRVDHRHQKLAPVRRVGRDLLIRRGDRFWNPPEPGMTRFWKTFPAAVPDTRGYAGWGFTHAALLSLGFVWRDMPDFPTPRGRGEARDSALAAAAADRGMAIIDVRPVRSSNVGELVHAVNPHAVVRPYLATIHLGDSVPSSAVLAIGQSRHFGGGLLVPDDRPSGDPIEVHA